MNNWDILEIEPTKDITTIKRAYIKQLRVHHPEEDPEGFLKLRQAYEAIIESIKSSIQKPTTHFKQTKSSDFVQDDEPPIVTAILFITKVKELYDNVQKRNVIEEWEKLLEEYTLWDIDEKQSAYTILSSFLQEHHEIDFDILMLLNKHFAWTEQADELISIFYDEDEIIHRAKETSNILMKNCGVSILLHRACYLGDQEKYIESINICDEIILGFGREKDRKLALLVVSALYNKGVYLKCVHSVRKSKEALSIFDEVINRCEEIGDKQAQLMIAKALINKGVCLSLLGKTKEELLIYEELINRFNGYVDIDFKQRVVKALYRKAEVLLHLKKFKEGIALFKDIISNYSSYEDKEIKEIIELSTKKLANLSGSPLAAKLLIIVFAPLFAVTIVKEPYNKIAFGIFILFMLIVFIVFLKKVGFKKGK